jgi:hypothetical protein
MTHIKSVRESAVSQYFFNIRRIGHEARDLRGVTLSGDAAVLDHALCMIKDLSKGGEHADPGSMMIVRNENLETVMALPFLAGCA